MIEVQIFNPGQNGPALNRDAERIKVARFDVQAIFQALRDHHWFFETGVYAALADGQTNGQLLLFEVFRPPSDWEATELG